MKSLGVLFLGAGLAAGLCSCASVSVRSVVPPAAEPPAQTPQTIYVRPFGFDERNLHVDREGQELEEFEKSLQWDMSKNLVERLRKYIGPAEILPVPGQAPLGNYWLITGQFTRVEQGSRFLRSAFGFGSGGTKMETAVTVSDLSAGADRPFLQIETTGGSNAMPGAILGVIYWPMILNGGEGLVAGVTGDCRRTSREIAAGLAAYIKDHGMPVQKGAPKPKSKGVPSWWPQKKSAAASASTAGS